MEEIPTTDQRYRRLRAAASWILDVIWPILRQALGWCFIVLGLLGLVLPILQGVLFLVIGIMLVGRRNRLIRWSGVHLKLALRRWAALRTPVIGRLGRLALRMQQEISRQRRRLHWWRVEQLARRSAPPAQLMTAPRDQPSGEV